MFSNDPSEFYNYHIDLIGKKKSKTVQMICVKLLNKIAEINQGMHNYIIDFSLQLFSFRIQNSSSQLQKFPVIEDDLKHLLIQIDEQTIIELSIKILNIMKQLNVLRKDILEKIIEWCINYTSLLTNLDTPPLIKFQILLFFVNYHDCLITNKFAQFCDNFIHLFISCIDIQEQSMQQANKFITFDCLQLLLQNQQSQLLQPNFRTQLFQLLIQRIQFQQCVQFFELICQIFECDNNYELSQDQILLCFEKCVLRIQEQPIINQIVHQNEIIPKLFNVLIAIQNNKKYKILTLNFEKLMAPLYLMLNKLEDIDFEDEILLMMYLNIKGQRKISLSVLEVIKTFPMYMQKTKNQLYILFKTITLILNTDQLFLQQNLSLFQIMFSITQDALNVSGPLSSQNKLEGILILHLLIIQYSHLFQEQQWDQVIEHIYKELSLSQTKRFLKGKLLITYLLSFYKNSTNIEQLLIQKGYIFDIINLIVEDISNYLHGYDRKIFVVSLCSILSFSQNPYIQQQYIKLFDRIIILLKVQELFGHENFITKIQNKKLNQNQKTFIESMYNDQSIIQIENSDSNSALKKKSKKMAKKIGKQKYKSTEEGQVDEMMRKYKTPILENINEFEIFQQYINNFRVQNQQGFYNIVAQLPISRQNWLKDAMQYQIISGINEKKQNTKDVRKIVKILHKKF